MIAKEEYFVRAPIIGMNTPIRETLSLIGENIEQAEIILVADNNGKIAGFVKPAAFINVLSLGTRLGWTLAAIINTEFIPLEQNEKIKIDYIKPDKPIIVLDHCKKPLGIIDKSKYLLHILQNDTIGKEFSFSSFFADVAGEGYLVADDNDIIIYANQTAERLAKRDLAGNQFSSCFPGVRSYKDNHSLAFDKVAIGNIISRWTGFLIPAAPSHYTAFRIEDITESEYSLQQLADAHNTIKELEEIIDNSYDEISAMDAEGVCIRINKACERLYGMKKQEIVGKTVKQFENDGLIALNSGIGDRVIKEKRRITAIQTTRTGRTIIATGNPVFDDLNQVAKVILNSRDITELSNIQRKMSPEETMQDRFSEIARGKLAAEGLVMDSPAMQQVVGLVKNVSRVDSTVLILGESGVGKGVVAKLIHDLSPRKDGPFRKINCSAIPDTLLESELFGSDRGAFTGAPKDGKPGLIELAQDGTLFLDEVGEIPLHLQAKLLQVIQDREILRVGGTKPFPVNIRIIAATNRDLEKMMEDGAFRKDLYYRLCVVPIYIPALRKRKNELPLLIQTILARYNTRYNQNKSISSEAMEKLVDYSWPGNIRELENLVERLCVTVSSSLISLNHLPDNILPQENKPALESMAFPEIIPLKLAVEKTEKALITATVKKYRNTYKAAEVLGVDQSTIVRKMQKYSISF